MRSFAILFLVHVSFSTLVAETIEFSRDIRPILSDKCFRCHGPDEGERVSDLRLDVEASALSELESGVTAIQPGRIEESELISRITSSDSDERMPPAESGKSLLPIEIEKLKTWVQQGAEWREHWSFIAPTRPNLPKTKLPLWKINPIDCFVAAKLDATKLRPSPVATRRALIRRVTLDLTGVSPTISEVATFCSDESPGAYQRLVERLLQSPRFGEHQTRIWLDAARYGDTHGLHLDNERSIWPYRDWVIHALNRNMAFDQFTIEQLAGDLLTHPTQDQLVATGFNRCNVTTSEGGSINEEYLVRYAVDRVETTATVWLGLTAGCAVCHDHKFDPISQREFYQLFAYFYSLTERAMDGNALLPPPVVKIKTLTQNRRERDLRNQLLAANQAVQLARDNAQPKFASWWTSAKLDYQATPAPQDTILHASLDENQGNVISTGNRQGTIHGTVRWDAGKFENALRLDGTAFVDCGAIGDFEFDDSFSYGAWVYTEKNAAATIVSKMDVEGDHRGYDFYVGGGRLFVHIVNSWDGSAIRVNTKSPMPNQKWQHVFMTYDGSGKASGVRIFRNGKSQELQITHDSLSGSIRTKHPFRIGRRSTTAPFVGLMDEVRVYPRALSESEIRAIVGADPIGAILATDASGWTEKQRQQLFEFYLANHDSAFQKSQTQQRRLEGHLKQLQSSLTSTLIMRELDKPRDTHILIRGQYDQKGEKVAHGIPEVLHDLPGDASANRLGLAKWLVDRANPLTARVIVNRIWQQYFGIGLVKTTEDFGSQGEWPSHPDLLDWLAIEFVESGWDLKHIHRLIVTSATYRQTSKVSQERYRNDPENRWLARGPRFRMDAEMIRDNALFVSGLLVERIGGKSVKPYQPDGLWNAVGYTTSNTARFKRDAGSALYRRSVYTFWKRTSPPPTMQIFDAPSREVCAVRRPRTNTPAGALVMMNDVQFVEAARNFGYRILSSAKDDKDRVRFAYETAVARIPSEHELQIVLDLIENYKSDFENDPTSAKKLISYGESPAHEQFDQQEQAVWTMVANAFLNLDEFLTKQ